MAAYLVVIGAVLPLLGHKDAVVLIFPEAAYSSIPLYLIWKGDERFSDRDPTDFLPCRRVDLYGNPAIVGLLLLIAGSVTL